MGRKEADLDPIKMKCFIDSVSNMKNTRKVLCVTISEVVCGLHRAEYEISHFFSFSDIQSLAQLGLVSNFLSYSSFSDFSFYV